VIPDAKKTTLPSIDRQTTESFEFISQYREDCDQPATSLTPIRQLPLIVFAARISQVSRSGIITGDYPPPPNPAANFLKTARAIASQSECGAPPELGASHESAHSKGPAVPPLIPSLSLMSCAIAPWAHNSE
jgi:hypothetical protein